MADDGPVPKVLGLDRAKLAAYRLTERMVVPSYVSTDRATDMLQNGTLDAMFLVSGTPEACADAWATFFAWRSPRQRKDAPLSVAQGGDPFALLAGLGIPVALLGGIAFAVAGCSAPANNAPSKQFIEILNEYPIAQEPLRIPKLTAASVPGTSSISHMT